MHNNYYNQSRNQQRPPFQPGLLQGPPPPPMPPQPWSSAGRGSWNPTGAYPSNESKSIMNGPGFGSVRSGNSASSAPPLWGGPPPPARPTPTVRPPVNVRPPPPFRPPVPPPAPVRPPIVSPPQPPPAPHRPYPGVRGPQAHLGSKSTRPPAPPPAPARSQVGFPPSEFQPHTPFHPMQPGFQPPDFPAPLPPSVSMNNRGPQQMGGNRDMGGSWGPGRPWNGQGQQWKKRPAKGKGGGSQGAGQNGSQSTGPPSKKQRIRDFMNNPLEPCSGPIKVREPLDATEAAEVTAWKEARRKHWPSQENVARRKAESAQIGAAGGIGPREERLRALREVLTKQASMGLDKAAGTTDMLHKIDSTGGRGRGTWQQGRGRGRGAARGGRGNRGPGIEHPPNLNGNGVQDPKEGVDINGGAGPNGDGNGSIENGGVERGEGNEADGAREEEERDGAGAAIQASGFRGRDTFKKGGGRHGQRAGFNGRGARHGANTADETRFNPQPQRPSLLEKLLEKDIRRDRSWLLQAIRFIVANNFLQDVDTGPLVYPCTEQSAHQNGSSEALDTVVEEVMAAAGLETEEERRELMAVVGLEAAEEQ